MTHRFHHIKLLPVLFATFLFHANFAFGATPSAYELLQIHVENIVDSAEIEDPELAKFKEALLTNADWMHQLCDAGPINKPEAIIEQLFTIWKADPALTKNPIDLSMATACAMEGPGRGLSSEDSEKRYQYFKKKHRQGLLNASYEDATIFQRRYLARGVARPGLNTVKSMEYLNNEVTLPVEQYGGAAYIIAYRGENHFGDSVFGPHYYAPFGASWETNAELFHNVGGVCGSLSNFGAAAAIANGVPATTMGEPGHCAYCVLTSPTNWQPGNSITWERGLFTYYYGNSWGWHLYNAKSQEDWEKTKKSGDLRRLAYYYLSKKKAAKANQIMQQARRHHPYEYQNWLVSAEMLEKTNASKLLWQNLHKDTLKYLTPISGEVAFNFLDKSLYPKLLPTGPENIKKRAAILLAFQRSLKDWGIFHFIYRNQFQRQLQLLDGDQAQQDAYAIKLFNAHSDNVIIAPSVISSQMLHLGNDKKRKRKFILAITKQLVKSSNKNKNSKELFTNLAKQALPEAAKNQDKKTFQFIGKMVSKNYPASTIKTEPFPGVLLSSGGTFSIGSAGNRWDSPQRHWGVIEPHGGAFHTHAENPTATVQLERIGLLTGVNIVQPGNFQRLVGAKLQVSNNNVDWTDVYTFTEAKQSYHIDLQGKNLIASHVRVKQTTGRFIHFTYFHVYGKKNS